MAKYDFDVITVGGGLGGAALARMLASNGLSVLVIERERQFKDRIRGEWIAPWGVAETQKLGICDLLMATCASEQPFFHFVGQGPPRDLRATTPQRLPAISFYHPAMQTVLLDAAASAGAEVWRGASVREAKRAEVPTVSIEREGRLHELSAQLIVCSDGRTSMGRKWGGFEIHRGPQKLFGAGLALEGMRIAPDITAVVIRPGIPRAVFWLPQSSGRTRMYVMYNPDELNRLRGDGDAGRFVEECMRSGAPPEIFHDSRPCGPIASFDLTETWADHPYREGLALVGDAAGCSDPTWGQGLSLALRDARVLGENLLNSNDWTAACDAYANEHDRYFDSMRKSHQWQFDLLLTVGPEADAHRACALPLLMQDPTRDLDHNFSGPEMPSDDHARRRFFGED